MAISRSSLRSTWLALVLCGAGVGVTLVPGAGDAQMAESALRAFDGTTYQVLRANSPDGFAAQLAITTIAGGITQVGSCSATGDMSGDVASAVSGVIAPIPLHSYADVSRTFILVPNDINTLTFDSNFGGRLTLGSGVGALDVCAFVTDCPNGSEPIVPISSSLGNVPPACIATNLAAACDGSNVRTAFAFGLPASGSPPVCTDSSEVTVDTAVCDPPPADGFTLNDGEAIVFIYYGPLQSSAFGIAVGGFSLSGSSTGLCEGGQVVGAAVAHDSLAAPLAFTPTNTPTGTLDTPTATNSPGVPFTATGSSTSTPTGTSTASNTAAPTATDTPSATVTATSPSTSTATATPTPTNTPTATDTRTDTPTGTKTPAATNTRTQTATATATSTASGTATNTPADTPTPAVALRICETNSFWGTHSCPETAAGDSTCEKTNSRNITQQVIDVAGGSLSICGRTLTDTHLNQQSSAVESLCVKGDGDPLHQLASQLTAAALNCVISGAPSTCSGTTLAAQFSACNSACAARGTTATVDGFTIDCLTAIDCANTGGAFDPATGRCQHGGPATCNTQTLCNPDVGLCFEPPIPPGGEKLCNDARRNDCTIFSDSPPCAEAVSGPGLRAVGRGTLRRDLRLPSGINSAG